MCETIPALLHTPSWLRKLHVSLTYIHLDHTLKTSHILGSWQTSKTIEKHFSFIFFRYMSNRLFEHIFSTPIIHQRQTNFNQLCFDNGKIVCSYTPLLTCAATCWTCIRSGAEGQFSGICWFRSVLTVLRSHRTFPHSHKLPYLIMQSQVRFLARTEVPQALRSTCLTLSTFLQS